MGVLKHVLGSIFGGIFGSAFKGLVSTIFSQLNQLIQGAFLALLKFIQQVVTTAYTPRMTPWETNLQDSVRGLFFYFTGIVFFGMIIVGLSNQRRRVDFGRATLTLVLAGLIAKLWFTFCDQLMLWGNDLSSALTHTFNSLSQGSQIGSSLPPDPFSAFMALILGAAGGYWLAIIAMMFPVVFLFTKFTALVFFCLRVVSTKAQSAWDWVFGLLLVSTILGRVAIITALGIGELVMKAVPFGNSSYGAAIIGVGAIGLAIYAVIKLVRNAPRISSSLTGGLVRTVSQITGQVTADVKNRVGISASGGIKAHANSMNARLQDQHRKHSLNQVKHQKSARRVLTAGTLAAAGLTAIGAAPVATNVKKGATLVAGYHKRRAERSKQIANEHATQLKAG